MAGNTCPTSVQVCAMRVARLEANGVPDPGPSNLYISDALVKFDWTIVTSDGDDIESKNGCGSVCVSYRGPDAFKRLDVKFELCTVDPELLEMLTSGSLLTRAGNSRGMALPRIGVPYDENGLSIELWSKNVSGGTLDADFPYVRWALPKVYNLQLGDGSLGNSALNPTITGQAVENANWHDGPGDDWFDLADQDMESAFGYVLDTDMPTAACGWQTLQAS